MTMDLIRSTTRVITDSAKVTTATAGAIGGAAVNGIVGGFQGVAKGIRDGVSTGSHSTPAALLTMGAIGAAGLVEWPVLLTVGGTALLVRQFAQHDGAEKPDESKTTNSRASTPRKRATSGSNLRRTAPAKSSRKPAKATPRKRATSR
jgi:hypothetical protein